MVCLNGVLTWCAQMCTLPQQLLAPCPSSLPGYAPTVGQAYTLANPLNNFQQPEQAQRAGCGQPPAKATATRAKMDKAS